MEKRIITVSREFGSGGRSVGKALAKRLGWKYYDKELVKAVAEKTGMSKKDTEAVIAATLGTITAALHEEEKVQLMGFGSFEVKKRAARTGRNPRSKETIEIPASQTPVFKAGKALKDAVAK